MSLSLTKLAAQLSDSFAVHLPDRRGRGISGPAGPEDDLGKDVEDLEAVLRESNTHMVFGVSAGAIVALQGALQVREITKAALFEPPLSFNGYPPLSWVPRYEHELSRGDLGGALATLMKGTLAEEVRVPHFMLKWIMSRNLKKADKRARQLGVQPFSETVPAMKRDIRIVQDSSGPLDRFGAVRCDVLLLGAEKSARYMKETLDGLGAAMPKARRVTIPGAGHAAATNNGKPELVAVELRGFFQGA